MARATTTKRIKGAEPLSVLRQNLPYHTVLTDLASACVGRKYFRSITPNGKELGDLTARDLSDDTPHSAAITKALKHVHTLRKSDALGETTFCCTDYNRFEALATEMLMCGTGALAMLNPQQLGLSGSRSAMRGTADMMYALGNQLDVMFIEGLLTDNTATLFREQPVVAYDFYQVLRMLKRSDSILFVLDASHPEVGSQADAMKRIETIYDLPTRQLLLSGLHKV